MNRRSGIAARLLAAQLIVLAVAGATLVATILLVARGLFRYHLQQAGETSPIVQQHAQEAFEAAFAIAMAVAGVAALVTAGLLFWLLARRVSRPIEELADAAESIAAGQYDVTVPDDGFGRELTTLAGSFESMARRLASADLARTRLLADLAHEIRTPLATLEAHIDGLEDGIVTADPETYAVMRAQVDRLRRLASDIRLAAAAQEHALHLHLTPERPAAVLDAACEAAAPRYTAKGVALTVSPPGTSHSCWPTPTGSGRCWPTCWTTPYATHPPVAWCGWPARRHPTDRSRSPSPTTATASLPTSSTRSSTDSTASTAPAPPPTAAAAAWASPSPEPSPPTTAAASPPPAQAAAPAPR